MMGEKRQKEDRSRDNVWLVTRRERPVSLSGIERVSAQSHEPPFLRWRKRGPEMYGELPRIKVAAFFYFSVPDTMQLASYI